MQTNILDQEQKSALALLKGNAEVGKFYLAGDTALVLHLGHRYAELDNMPRMIKKVDCKEVKKFFETEVQK